MNYELDGFLNVDTWHTFHPLDEQRFYIALSKIISDPKFNVAKMADEIRARGHKDGLMDDVIERNVEHYENAAIAVDGYLQAIGEKRVN